MPVKYDSHDLGINTVLPKKVELPVPTSQEFGMGVSNDDIAMRRSHIPSTSAVNRGIVYARFLERPRAPSADP